MLGLYKFDRFEGFTAADFDAFAKPKWASNRFNLERMRARAVMEALGKDLAAALGDHVAGLTFRTSLHNPDHFNRHCVRNMWLYLDRTEEDKHEMEPYIDRDTSLKTKVLESTPEQRFAMTGVLLCEQGASVFLRIHADAVMDRRNLVARLADPMEAQQALALLSHLPPLIRMSLGDVTPGIPAVVGDVESLRRGLEELSGWFCLEAFFDRTDPTVSSASFVATATALLPPLVTLWRFAAWSRGNDRLKLTRVIKEERRHKAKKQAGFSEGDSVQVTSGLLAGKQGTVQGVDNKGRVRVLIGRVSVDMDPKLLRK
jgi:hypothetical protein